MKIEDGRHNGDAHPDGRSVQASPAAGTADLPEPSLPAIFERAWRSRHARTVVLAGLAAVAYVAAINRVQVMPWVLAALLSATLVVGTLWPRWLVRRLEIRRDGPQRAAEGDTVLFRVELENRGWLPRFMVELVDRVPFVGAATGATAGTEQTLGVVAHVPGGGRRHLDVPILCEKRGFYRLGPVAVASSFPLGLARARLSREDGVRTLTVYPDVFPIVALPLRGAPSQIHRSGYLLPQGGGAAEFCGLREYRRGDHPRHIHWPTTARLNELMVKEFEPLASACIYIALDQAADANVGGGRLATFEYAVRIAASIAGYACANNIPTRLAGAGLAPLYLPGGSGEGHYRGILDALAVVAADGREPYAKLLERVAIDCRRGETVVAFIAEPALRIADTLSTLALLRERGANLFVLVFDRSSFDAELGGTPSGAAAVVLGTLLNLGIQGLVIRRDDDLTCIFNP